MSAALAAACLIHEVPLRGKPTIAQPSADPALQATDNPAGLAATR